MMESNEDYVDIADEFMRIDPKIVTQIKRIEKKLDLLLKELVED